MLLLEAVLTDGLAPIGVIVVHLILIPLTVVVELADVRSVIAQVGVVVGFLHEHSVLVTIQQAIALRLLGKLNRISVSHLRLATGTTLCLDFDDTITTSCTPNGRCGGILQYGDGGDIVRVDLQKLCELVFRSVGIVQIDVMVVLEDIAIDHNERFTATIDGGDTTQTHRGA